MAGRRAVNVVVLCFAWAGVAFGGPQPSREDFVRALMQRSRIVDDVRFQLPVEIYRLYLIEQATRPQPAPVAYIIERGLYGVTLDANSQPIMRVELSIRVLDSPRCREIPMLSTALAWDVVTVNGKPGGLAAKPGWLVLMPDKPGVYELTATAKLGRQWADAARVALDVQRSVRTAAKFDAAGAWQVSAPGSTGLTASGSAGLTASAPAEAGTHVELAMPPTDRIDIAWTHPVELPPRPPQFEIGGAIAWNIDAGRQQISARMNVRILGGATDRLELAIPAGAVRCEITGPDVREMRLSGGSAAVFLRGKVTGQTRLNISYELPNGPAGQGTGVVKPLPAPKLADGHWSGGTLVITNTAGASELIAGNIRSLREIYEGDIPADARAILAGKPVLAYEITARDFDASVEVLDLGELALRESIADLAHYQVLFRPDGSVMCKVDYEIRNRTSQFLRVHMPAGAAVLSARVNDVPTALTPLAGEADVSLLPLVRSKASVKGLVSFPVQIVLLYRAAALVRRGLADVPLPTIDLPIAYGWCDLYAPEGMAVSQWSGPMRSVERLSSETAIASLGYGAGELAEGYREDKRLKLVTAPKPKVLHIGFDPNTPLTVGQSLPIKLPTVTAPQQLETSVSVPDGGTVVLGGQHSTGEAEREMGAPILSKVPITSRLFDNRATVRGERPTTQPAAAPPPAMQPPAGPGRGGVSNGAFNLDTTVTVPSGGGTLTLNGGNTYTGAISITGGTVLLGGQSLLAKNYYSAGKDYYEKGRYEQAAESLGNAARMAPGSVEASNAKRLLANINVVQGKGKAASQQEKALGRQVQTEIAGQNVKLEQQQQELIEQAGVALKSGRLGEAQAAYKAAEGLGGQLLAKGAGKGEQDALLRESRQELAQLEQGQGRQVEQLRRQYEQVKGSGEVTKALAIGNALKELSAEGDEKKALTEELEKLVIASVRHSDRADRLVMAREAGKVSSPLADANGYYAAVRIEDLGARIALNAPPAPSGSITTFTTSGTRFTRGDGGLSELSKSRDAFTIGPVRSPDGGEAATGQLNRFQNRTEDQSTFGRALPAGNQKLEYTWTLRAPDSPPAGGERPQNAPADVKQANEPIRRVYDVRDLIVPVPNFEGPRVELQQSEAPRHEDPLYHRYWKQLTESRGKLETADAAGTGTGGGTGGGQGTFEEQSGAIGGGHGTFAEKAGGGGGGIFAEQGGGQGTGIFDDTDSDQPRREITPKEKLLENLVALMRNSIDRESWADPTAGPTDGTPGFVQIENGSLVVTQSPQNQQVLAELMEKLREARTPPGQRGAAAAPVGTDADAAIRDKLKKQIERLSFQDIDLADVIKFLREQSGINIRVNWDALTQAGIEQTTKLSAEVRNITVKRALELVLRDASGAGAAAGPESELQYVIDGDVLTISTRADLAKKTARGVYNIGDLLEPVPDFEPPSVESPQDAAMTKKLKTVIERLSFADIDFRDVITFFREYSDANIHVNWRALTAAGIEQTTKVSVDVRKVTVERALDLVLLDVSGSMARGPESELKYWSDGEVLTISTRADLARERICKVYDVRDLLVRDSLGVTHRWQDMDNEELVENITDLISLMRNSIDRESWCDQATGPTAGTPGYVQLLGGMLVVTQSVQNHRALAEMFERLRSALAAHDHQTPIESAADAAARDMLQRKIEKLSFTDIDFRDAITFLREYSGFSIHVNWRALTAAGIEQTTKVSIELRNITVKRALDIVLRDVSGSGAAAGPESELRYIIDGGVLTISTKADLAKEPVRKIYDVRDLLPPAPQGAAGLGEPPAIRRQRMQARKKGQENFIALMRNMIDRESWADSTAGPTAGTPGFVQAMSGLLVVTQTPENHQALGELFEKIRKTQTAQNRPVPAGSAADLAVVDKLKSKIDRLSLTDIDLKDIITFLREYSDANIHVNWRAITAAGIEPTKKISLNVRKVAVKQALDMVLRQVNAAGSAAGPESALRYVIDDGVLIISTKADLAKEPIRRVYDVHDMLVPVPDFGGPGAEAQGGFGFAGQGIFTTPEASADRRQVERANERLLENLFALMRKTIDRESWADPSTGPTAGTPGFVQILDGMLVVAQSAENHQAVAELIENLHQAKAAQDRPAAAGAGGAGSTGSGGGGGGQGIFERQPMAPAQPGPQPAQPGAGVVTRVYDVRDLAITSDGKRTADDINRRAEELAANARAAIGSPQGREDGRAAERVGVDNGRLVVTAGLGGQESVQQLMGRLREIRGPQVEISSNIAGQRASGLVSTGSGTLTIGGAGDYDSDRVAVTAGAGREATKAQLEDFIRRNYDWQISGAGGGTGAAVQGGVQAVEQNLAAKLASNLGQSVNVNSSNISITPAKASQLGIEFQQGVNSLRYATVDEAQLRTLRQLEGRQDQEAQAVAANPRLQNTIVGTEALLAGGQRAYVARAGEGSNTFEVAGNPIDLSHEKYIVLDAGGYLTAVKASQMQHWTQQVSKEDVGFADVPQELDVPRVGNLVRFEKTLIRPADRLTIRAEYTWKGAVK